MLTETICVDSSFLISLLYKNGSLHEKAKELFFYLWIEKSIVIINNFIIEEVTTVFTYKWFINLVPYFYKLLDSLNTNYSNLSIEDYKMFFLKLNKKISFADSSIILDSLKYKAKIVTFDEQLERIFKNI